MRIVLMTREYPPHVYGGAGVHVTHLARHLADLSEVEVRCFGDGQTRKGNPLVRSYATTSAVFGRNPHRVRGALDVFHTCLHLNAEPVEADVIHCHTWYSMLAGIVAHIGYGVPLVATVHSLEPLRPWKREQLGRGYDLSSWVEQTALEMADAVIAVSQSDRDEIRSRFRVADERIHVIPNGVDTERHRPVRSHSVHDRHGIEPNRPTVLFLGRVSRQKGIGHFLAALRHLAPEVQAVLCAWPADTAELADEVGRSVEAARARGRDVIWIREQVPVEEAVELYSHASVFCCPSVYEPFGIINLEAMACGTPVVASRVGGIVETVVDGETGFLVDVGSAPGRIEPADPDAFARALADGMNRLIADEALRAEMGRRGRERVAEHFGWPAVASRVMEVYREVAGKGTA